MRILSVALAALLAGCAVPAEPFSSAPPSLRVGAVALAAGQPDIAGSVAEHHLATAPDDPAALLLRAQARAAQGRDTEAAADFRQVIRLLPGSVEATLGLARILMATDPAAAGTILAEIAVRGGAPASVWNNLGVARDLVDHQGEAQAAYRNALAADPSMASAQLNLAHSFALAATPLSEPVLPLQASPPLAAAPLPTAPACIAAAPPAPAPKTTFLDNAVAAVSRFAHASQDALRLAEARLRCDPANFEGRLQVVSAALKAGEGSRARQLATQTIQQAPADPRGYLMEGAVDYSQGDSREALKSLFKARDLQRAAIGTARPGVD